MYAENKGVKIWYEIHGQGELTLIMIPGFQIVHSEAYKRYYVPFLSRHMRVVTLDLRGSGKSGQPDEGYDLENWTEDIQAVVEAAGLDRFAMAGSSCGAPTCIQYNANYPGKVSHLILLNGFAKMVRSNTYPQGMPGEAVKGALQFWHDQPEDMLKGFIELIFSEKYTLRGKELIWQWAHETLPEIWGKGFLCAIVSNVDEYLDNIDIPVLIIAAKDDQVVFPSASEYIDQKIPDSRLFLIPDSGHGFSRTWPQVSRHILDFLMPDNKVLVSEKDEKSAPRFLWISSPIGLGHVKRDLSIANEMRKQMPEIIIDWLAIDPVKSFLESFGEQIHPLSDALWNECIHVESYCEGSYSLNVAEAYWEMDKLLNNNFMVFYDAVRENQYDLVVGDESWELAEYLHYNPSLKTASFVFMTDFIGLSNVSDDEIKQAHVYNVNGTWVEMREKHPDASDLSIFIGEPEDIPDRPFGEELPNRREWAKEHFEFSGYVLPFDPANYSNRQLIRKDLEVPMEAKLLLLAVGGTSVGRSLIEKSLQAQKYLDEKIPGIRTVVLCGPRIDPKSFGRYENVEFKPFVLDPIQYFAVCDLAVIQGGLSTAMELTALGRPFIYFPLKDHFEQQEFVPLRLQRYRAGVRMDFDATSPEDLALSISENIAKSVNYHPVNTDGAKKAASMILGVIDKGES
jgi:pimeloyl-ACP methyl ester carboxylesterase